jgi:hypothetical protein
MKEQSKLGSQFKDLPKDDHGNITDFWGSKYHYRVFQPGDPLGIVRQSVYSKNSLWLSVGQTSQMIVDLDRDIIKIATSSKPAEEKLMEIVSMALSRQRAVLEKGKLRYDLAFYQCTVFCVRDGDSPAEWTHEMALSYIEDWAECINPESLFFFAQSCTVGLNETLRSVQKDVERQSGSLSAYFGTKTESGFSDLTSSTPT